MGKRSFTLNPNNCIIKFGKPNSACFFDSWSKDHFYWQGFFFIIIFHFFQIKNLRNALILAGVLTGIHIIEEYLGNTSKISLEGLFVDYIGPLINPKIKTELRELDNDYLQNSIGDVLSGLLSNILIICYWLKYKRLPYIYLLFSILIIYLLYRKSHMLYDEETKRKLRIKK
jgi:hypothetical protein